ncbi:hypothetical protein [Nitratifractor salsuginis]|uniref:Uncharacterized protein n=1 Tax=Nitratifractor salsuginis (strain DSM 16511 / JCM 12458 / E9I37-1) TaxID=749222 RepID=E6X1R0_NITSE|nr:hypothetical protein [Nitratifractor salsuginis]ADV47051.1 hypothetical protein Nitsa_1806 [Nitratifractor salsuginis DSM 16511]
MKKYVLSFALLTAITIGTPLYKSADGLVSSVIRTFHKCGFSEHSKLLRSQGRAIDIQLDRWARYHIYLGSNMEPGTITIDHYRVFDMVPADRVANQVTMFILAIQHKKKCNWMVRDQISSKIKNAILKAKKAGTSSLKIGDIILTILVNDGMVETSISRTE